MITDTLIKYWKFPEVIIVAVAFLLSFTVELSGYLLLTICLVPIIIYKVFYYFHLYRQVLNNDSEIFGITRSSILFTVLSTVLIGGLMMGQVKN